MSCFHATEPAVKYDLAQWERYPRLRCYLRALLLCGDVADPRGNICVRFAPESSRRGRVPGIPPRRFYECGYRLLATRVDLRRGLRPFLF